jgi:hypothetical protein
MKDYLKRICQMDLENIIGSMEKCMKDNLSKDFLMVKEN